MIGSLDKKRGIVNVPIRKDGRLTYLSMDEGLANLALQLFDGDVPRCRQWMQNCVNDILLKQQEAEIGVKVKIGGLSRMIQREIVALACKMLKWGRRD